MDVRVVLRHDGSCSWLFFILTPPVHCLTTSLCALEVKKKVYKFVAMSERNHVRIKTSQTQLS